MYILVSYINYVTKWGENQKCYVENMYILVAINYVLKWVDVKNIILKTCIFGSYQLCYQMGGCQKHVYVGCYQLCYQNKGWCSRPLITIRSHDLLIGNIRRAMDKIASYHHEIFIFFLSLVPASFKFFDLSLAFSLVFPVMVPTIDFY